MKNKATEFVWSGRVHLGDEPGIYGDAHYSGLAVEFPLDVFNYGPAAENAVIVECESVRIFPPYLGHKAVVVGYTPAAGGQRWDAAPIGEARIVQDGVTSIGLPANLPAAISVRVQIDTDVPPGLYDDFVLTGVSLKSAGYYASFGFRYRP